MGSLFCGMLRQSCTSHQHPRQGDSNRIEAELSLRDVPSRHPSPRSLGCLGKGSFGRLFAVLLLVAGTVSFASSAIAAPAKRYVNPRVFGFDLPPGPVRQGEGRRVTTKDRQGNKVVAKLHVEIGSNQIMMLPDGELVARSRSTAKPTDKPFVSIKKGDLAKRLQAEFPTFRIKRTRRYIYVYNTSDAFANGASRIIESMFPGMMGFLKSMGLKPHEPDVPLVIMMFRTRKEFLKQKQMPEGVVAYYSIVTNRVLMYEQVEIGKIKPELAIRQSISTIAHENVHQILHNVGVQNRMAIWPQWILEGTAEFFAPTTTDRRFRWKGPGKTNDMRLFELDRYLKAKVAEAQDGKMIEDTVLSARLTSTGYATSWALVHYLARYKRPQFNKYMRAISALKPTEGALGIVSPGIVPDNKKLFVKCFGSDFPTMQKRVVGHVKKLPYHDPFAEFVHYVATIELVPLSRKTRRANIFHSKALAKHWIDETMEKIPQKLRQGARASLVKTPNLSSAQRVLHQWINRPVGR